MSHVQTWLLLSIRGLPYTTLLEEAMLIQSDTLLGQEVTSISKMMMGYVNKTIVLTVDYYINDNGDISE